MVEVCIRGGGKFTLTWTKSEPLSIEILKVEHWDLRERREGKILGHVFHSKISASWSATVERRERRSVEERLMQYVWQSCMQGPYKEIGNYRTECCVALTLLLCLIRTSTEQEPLFAQVTWNRQYVVISAVAHSKTLHNSLIPLVDVRFSRLFLSYHCPYLLKYSFEAGEALGNLHIALCTTALNLKSWYWLPSSSFHRL